MNRSLRFGTALSALAISAAVTGCAIGRHKPQSAQASNVDKSKIGLATKAQVAVEAGKFAEAVSFAEQAVDGKPRDPGFRALLGNIYFAAGRFASAESAYRDALSLDPSQPELTLKLALAQIAQGKNANALGVLQGARGQLEAADYGLAIALAGLAGRCGRGAQPGRSPAERRRPGPPESGAGLWAERRLGDGPHGRRPGHCRREARFDAPAVDADGQADARFGPGRRADRRHAGCRSGPAGAPGADPPGRDQCSLGAGRLHRSRRLPLAQPTQELAALALPPAAPLPPVPVAEPLPMEQPRLTDALFAEAPAPVEKAPARFDDQPKTASYVAISKKIRKAAAPRANGKADAVVQLGAYGSPQRVAAAWNNIARRHPSVNRYTPMSARFDAGAGTVYRLSVKGFASSNEAQKLCGSLRSKRPELLRPPRCRRRAGPLRFALISARRPPVPGTPSAWRRHIRPGG